MANRRAIVKRRKAVRNIHKITKTMQLIAMARFQSAMNRATASRPYADKLAELVRDLSGAAGDFVHPLMERPDSDRSALLVLTSDRGLCGGYNAAVIRQAIQHIDAMKAQGIHTDVHMVGKKGIGAFRFRQRDVDSTTVDVGDTPRFDLVEPIANKYIDQFRRGEISSLYVAYTHFYSAGRREAEVEQILPLSPEDLGEETGGPLPQYEFEPSPEELLNQLLPASVRMRLFQAFNDAAVSEQIARMIAMKAATEAANDMIRALTRQYNRARQTHITMELLDIVGGANALEGGA